MSKNINTPVCTVQTTDSTIIASIEDPRTQTHEFFSSLPREEWDPMVLDVWNVGLRALIHTQMQMDTARLEEAGAKLVGEVKDVLTKSAGEQTKDVEHVLGKYFDPADGKLPQKLEALLSDRGELATVLRSHLEGETSTLARTLAAQVGESSPLWKRLSSTDSEGFLKTLESQIEAILQSQQKALLDELDPGVETSAISKLITNLRKEMEQADQDRTKQLEAATKALDANDENSQISRLLRETTNARTQILEAISPDRDDSPMAAIRKSVQSLLEKHETSIAKRLDDDRKERQTFEAEVRSIVERLETKKEAAQKSPVGGIEFEEAFLRYLNRMVAAGPYVVEATGNSVGHVARCKKGDAVVTFGPDTAFPGARVVFEAKHRESVTVGAALAELEEARKNRAADVGVFVMARSHAAEGFPAFSRHGNDVLVIWDAEDTASDPYLTAAIYVGLSLVARCQDGDTEADLTTLRQIESDLTSEIKRLEDMRKSADAVVNHGEKLQGHIRNMKRGLDRALDHGREALEAFGASTRMGAEERERPIRFERGLADEAASSDVRLPRVAESASASDVLAPRTSKAMTNGTQLHVDLNGVQQGEIPRV